MGKADIKLEESKDKVRLKSRRKDVLPTKIVIRRLPPTLTEDQLKDEWTPFPEHDYFRFEGPDYSLGPVAFSRVYLNLKNFNDIFTFQSKYDGYIFVDARGNEYSAVVEPAPYQKVPKLIKKRKDVKCATIEKDPDYIAFLESLGKEEEAVTSYQETLQQMEAAKADPKANKKTTPLIEFLKAKHAARTSARAHTNSEKRGGKDGRDAEKETSKGGKKDSRLSAVESRGSGSDNQNRKGSDKKAKETTKKEDGKDKKSSPTKDKQTKDSKEHNKENKGKLTQRKSKEKITENDRSNRGSSGRGDQQKRKEKDRERDQDERSRDFRSEKKGSKSSDGKEYDAVSPQKSGKGGQSRSDEAKPYKGSIKHDDPVIVAFSKSGEVKESEDRISQERRDHGDERGPSGRVRNKDRPAREIYRPPVRPSSATSRSKDSRGSPEKVAHSDREQSHSEKGSSKDRYKYSSSKDKDRDRTREKDTRSRDSDRDRDRDREKDYDRDRDRSRYKGRYSDRDREKGKDRDRDRDWEQERDRGKPRDDDRDYSHRDSGRRRDEREREYSRDKNRDRNDKHRDADYSGSRDREKVP